MRILASLELLFIAVPALLVAAWGVYVLGGSVILSDYFNFQVMSDRGFQWVLFIALFPMALVGCFTLLLLCGVLVHYIIKAKQSSSEKPRKTLALLWMLGSVLIACGVFYVVIGNSVGWFILLPAVALIPLVHMSLAVWGDSNSKRNNKTQQRAT